MSEFLSDPIGHYCRGRRSLVFAYTETLLGFACWGRPDVDDVRELLRMCEMGLKPGSVPYRWLVDLRGLELVEPGTFGLFLEHARKHREILGHNIIRQAQLRPEGLVGAVISGFSHVAKLSYPDRVFADVEEALAWLPVEPELGVPLIAELEAIRSSACESFLVVGQLRRLFETAGVLTIEDAALRCGLSTRTLQRALREAGTTYRLELKAFRIRRAQELLSHGERNLTWIAAEVGFSSVQHFATAYRRAIGDTPSAWRARQRASP